ncbi:MAG: LysM peptidoglycan-binding domain-containing protein, partial [Alphaproteobacteria bacterium]
MSGNAKFALWLVLGLLLSACGQSMGPAPVVQGGTGETLRPGTPAAAVAGQTVTVQRGDALYKIARRYNVGLRSLIDANGLKPPYTIYPGQKLRLPSSGVHVVRRGETVYQIANRYNTEPGTLVRLNRISPPYRLYPGQKIVLPGSAAGPTPPQRATETETISTPRQ